VRFRSHAPLLPETDRKQETIMAWKALRSRWATAGLAGATGLAIGVAAATTAYPPAEVLLDTSATIIGQPIVYPDGVAEVTAAIITMEPGQTTGWHRHDAPLFAYILEGRVRVDYGRDGTRLYRKGDAFVEALGSAHNGRNPGRRPTRILAVFAGAEGVANTVPLPDSVR
jgi:quercetin dioxygenase-like cupin family protein